MFVLFVFGVHLLVLAWVDWRRHGDGGADAAGLGAARPEMPEDCSLWPAVTVQVPLYNEQLVATRILDACSELDWPRDRLQIQILDDSDDATSGIVAEWAARCGASKGLDIQHVRRRDRAGYKAGALAHGMSTATGVFMAILDADFVPRADFLTRLMPLFEDARTGLVQARWGHLNEEETLLTRVQAFGLDAHFNIEQRTRQTLGCFINFNGTAGIWRREAIVDAGGWQSHTLTEDLDLSYRAQLREWHLRYDFHTCVSAELPVSMNAFRAQQHRWTKGGVQTAVKLLGPLWRAAVPMRSKWEGTLHLTANMVFPFILLAALLHGPVVLMPDGPGEIYFGFMTGGLVGFAGFLLAHVASQRALHTDWKRRMMRFPVFMAGSIGMCLNNSQAILEIMLGRETPFRRTPKFAARDRTPSEWWLLPYASVRLPAVLWAELGMAAWSVYWLIRMVQADEWFGVPFQILFASGFLFVSVYNLLQARLTSP